MFSLTSDQSRNLIVARMAGFMTVEEVEEFSRQEQSAVEAMGLGCGEFLLLINTDDAVIQSQEVVAAFKGIVTGSRFKARRIAVVRHDTITRMQTRRILEERADAAVFETMDEAQDWLLSA